MNEDSLREALAPLGLGALRYFASIGSTNDEALAWAAQGAPHFSLVVADEQTRGRGRLNRSWFTPRGCALAASLILRPNETLDSHFSHLAGLTALAVAETCRAFGLAPQIKWPNDVLLNGKKFAGILIESVWTGEEIEALAVGVGINVRRAAVPPAEELLFPATSMEDALEKEPPAREEILRGVLQNFAALLPRMGTDEFLQAWEALLAFRGAKVEIRAREETLAAGELLGLGADGDLRLRDSGGRIVSVRYGDLSLRPAA